MTHQTVPKTARLSLGDQEIDLPVMAGLTVLLWQMGRGWRRPGRINRWEAGGLLTVYAAYTLWLLWTMGPR